MTLVSLSILFFFIMDPIGNVSTYLKLVQPFPPAHQRKILLREMGIALGLMVVFHYFGEVFFNILELSETSIRLSIGLILFLVAIRILFPSINGIRDQLPQGEPFIIPLATPLIAGPALLATIMLFAHIENSQTLVLLAIFISWLASFTVFAVARRLHKILGNNGLLALEKLLGMILVLLAIQRFMEGVQLLLTT